MKPLAVRKLHRKIAPILFVPLLISAITGVAYQIGRSWLNLPDDKVAFLLSIHQGSFLGTPLKPIYVLLVGLGLLGLIATGFSMVLQLGPVRTKANVAQLDARRIHRIIGPIMALPLIISAITGLIYRLGRSWFDLPAEQAEMVISLHAGEYLGNFLNLLYILLIGLGLTFMLVTGLNLMGLFRKRPSRSA